MKPIALLALLGLFTLVVFVRQSVNRRPVIRAQALAQPQVIAQKAETDAFRLKLHRIVAKAERSIQEENTSLAKSTAPAAGTDRELTSHSVD